MALSGQTLPQVSSGGSINTTWHIVTDDGCGPVEALVDSTATGKWSTAAQADVTTSMPGTAGECPASFRNDSGEDYNKIKRTLRRALQKMGLVSKRAENVNMDFVSYTNLLPSSSSFHSSETNIASSQALSVSIPAGTTCTGTINGVTNLCLVKMSNNNANGPFGGVVAVQMAGTSTTARSLRYATRAEDLKDLA